MKAVLTEGGGHAKRDMRLLNAFRKSLETLLHSSANRLAKQEKIGSFHIEPEVKVLFLAAFCSKRHVLGNRLRITLFSKHI